MNIARLSYTIWFTQRTGSTWLSELLSATQRVGHPAELLNFDDAAEALNGYRADNADGLVAKLRDAGTGETGIFGLKYSFSQPRFERVLPALGVLAPDDPRGPLSVWEAAFPNHRHVFMTRRNKVRLAVSWWKAIRTGEWHRRSGHSPSSKELVQDYDFAAIDHLLNESVMREAGIDALFAEAGVTPLTIAYEDLLTDLEGQWARFFAFLDLPPPSIPHAATALERQSDRVTEVWVERFRQEKQQGWTNRGW